MARHLYIGNAVAVSYDSNGLLADGAIDIQKLSSDGPTSLLPGDTLADSDQIRVVQGGPAGIDVNIVSPWVYGRDVVAWGGRSHAAQAAQVSTVTIATNATAAANHTLKIVNLTDGAEPFELKSYEIAVLAGATPATQAAAFVAALNADLPHWINTAVDSGGGVITLTGFTKGATKADGSVQGEVVLFDVVDDLDGDNGTTAAFATTTAASRGNGDSYYIKEMEEELRGAQYGFYNRIHQPNTPAQSTVIGDSYDVYHIVTTKDGSSASQIHGVDNLIEIYIAFDNGTAALTMALEGQLNPYLNAAGFANVNL